MMNTAKEQNYHGVLIAVCLQLFQAKEAYTSLIVMVYIITFIYY